MVVKVEGLEFRADSPEDEPRMLDIELGEEAGMSRPRDIRQAIKAGIADKTIRENEHYRAARAVGAREKGQGNRVAQVEYWLTEAGALKIITRLRTPKADAQVDKMIRVYRAAIRAISTPAPPLPVVAPVLDLAVANGVRVGETVLERNDMAAWLAAAAGAQNTSRQRMHGFIRRTYKVSSVYNLALSAWPFAKDLLQALALKRLTLPGKPAKLRLLSSKQLPLRDVT